MRDILAKLSDTLTGREKRHAALLFGLMIVGAILEMLGVGAIPAFITLLSDPHRIERISWLGPVLSRAASHGDNGIVLWAAAVLFLLFVIKNSYLATLTVLTARYVTRRQINIASRLFAVYVSSPYTFHLQRNTAELLRNANNEALDVVGAVLMPGLTLLMEALTVTAIFGLLLVAEPFISLVAFVFLGGSTLLFIRVIRRRMMYYGKLVQEYRMRMIQTVNEALGGIKITRVLGREQHFLKAYAYQADQFAESLRYRQIMTELPRLYLEVVAIVGILGIAALLIIQRRPVQAIIPTLSILAVAIVRMIPSFNRITSSLTSIRYGRFSLDVVHADLMAHRKGDSAREVTEARIARFSSTIGLEKLTFQYEGAATPAVNGVELEISRGTVVGFVGPTGSGKTTLVDLILGLLEPTSGRILVDGSDLRGRVRQWQVDVGYVPQDVFLVDDSIRRNVAFGIDEDSIDEIAVRRAVDAAQLTEFIETLPAGLDTVVGERGVRLSGGQRQRIGIARALYHNPSVLILDEATSSLDNETERYVMEAVEFLRGERTIILVAHRMSTVRACDQIFVLNDGRLVATGTYDELLGSSSAFRRLAAVV